MSTLLPNQRSTTPCSSLNGTMRVRNGRNTPSAPRNGNTISNAWPVATAAVQRSRTRGNTAGSWTAVQPPPFHLRRRGPAVRMPAAVVPDDVTVGVGDPAEAREIVGQPAECTGVECVGFGRRRRRPWSGASNGRRTPPPGSSSCIASPPLPASPARRAGITRYVSHLSPRRSIEERPCDLRHLRTLPPVVRPLTHQTLVADREPRLPAIKAPWKSAPRPGCARPARPATSRTRTRSTRRS